MQNDIPAEARHDGRPDRGPRLWAAVALALLGLLQVVRLGAEGGAPQPVSFEEASRIANELARQQPGSRLMIVASTYSMYPTLDWDSIVVVAPVAISQVQVGDVVCFNDEQFNGRRMITHRVEKILQKDHRLITRGDNLDRADRHPVGAEALVGKVVYAVYFDRSGERRPVEHVLPTPARTEQVRRL